MKNENTQFNKPVSMATWVYNEENHIEKVIREYYTEIFLKLHPDSEYIIYLDVPTDNTANVVKNLSQQINIKIIEGTENLGYAGAMAAALKATKNDIIFYSDSSGKHQAKDFWNLIKYVDKYDIISGLRKPRTDHAIRRITTFIQRIIVSVLFLVPFHDFNTGYKIIHRKVIDNVLNDCKYMKQTFPSELLLRAYKKGYTIKDVPVVFKNRPGKNTGTNYKMLPQIISKSLKGYILLKKELAKK